MALVVTQSNGAGGLERHTYDNLDTLDTAPKTLYAGGTSALAGSMQVVGSFGSGTVVLQGSNNGTDWVTLKGLDGEDISLTATGMVEFSTSALYLRPLITGGTADDVDVYIVLRG
jgi:hypothetical protein